MKALTVTPILMLLLAAFFWGAGNVANKTVLTHMPPDLVAGLRVLLASLVMVPLAIGETRLVRWPKGMMGSAVVLGLLFVAALMLQQMAFAHTSVTNASFLVNTCSILTPLVAWLWLREQPNGRILLAALVALAGALLMAGQVSLWQMNPGDVLCLASAVFYAAWIVALGRHAMRFGRPFSTCLVQFGVAALVSLPVPVMAGSLTIAGVEAAWPELLVLGLFSTAAAFVLQTWAQARVPAPVAAVLVSAESLFGAAGAWLLLHEVTPLRGLAGAALILCGITMAALSSGQAKPAQGSE